MTNGEKMQEMFPEGKTRRCKGGVVFESDGWCHAYDSDWWNTEHKEPTTKNNLGDDCISRKAVFETIDDCNRDGLKGIFCSYDDGERFKEYIKNLPPITPQFSSELDKNSKKLEKDFGESDCISRQAVLELIADYDLSMGQVVRGIHALPPVTSQEPRWIPVNERLPEENKTVIASTKYGVYPEARYSKEDGWEWAYESGADYWEEIACNVLAWMPLPQPYSEVTE